MYGGQRCHREAVDWRGQGEESSADGEQQGPEGTRSMQK